MTYTISIDQEFAIVNDLTMVQVSTLAAFMTLPIWSKTVAIDGFVWYQYSDDRMAEDFPLLFGVPKRCYKNISELADMGFVELTKLGKSKFVRFTDKCADWGRKKVQNWTESPKTDSKKSENGLTPYIDSYNNKDIYITNNIKDKAADGGISDSKKVKNSRSTSEPAACLFANSRFAEYEKFAAEFESPEYANIDIAYYFHAVADWSAQKGKKMKDWIATARNFMRSDHRAKKLVTIDAPKKGGLSQDDIDYLKMMAE